MSSNNSIESDDLRKRIHALIEEGKHQATLEGVAVEKWTESLLEEATAQYRETHSSEGDDGLVLTLMRIANDEAQRLLIDYQRHGAVGRA